MQPNIIGWDIGGAHVKIAIANNQTISQVQQLPCPLWKGIDQLSACISSVEQSVSKSVVTTADKNINFNQYEHAITMTGELVDHFVDRKQGVLAIIEEMSDKLHASNDNSKVQYYAGTDGFVNTQQAIASYKNIASANWLASVNYAASKISNALFIDIGSTTTDIVEVRDNKATFTGYTDEQRLIEKELVYCGVVRTPVFAIHKSAQVKGQQIPVINEYFSNMADVYRLTDELPAHADLSDTLDGCDKDMSSSAIRLARMFANDAKQDELEVWREVAKQIRNSQVQMIKDACRHQFMKKNVPLTTPIIGAGVGRFLVKDLASQLGRDYVDFDDLFETISLTQGFGVGDCAPAASVACLASSSFSGSSTTTFSEGK